MFYNLSQKTKAERMLPKSFFKASITLLPKLYKESIRNKIFRVISLMNMEAKILNKILTN